MNTSEICLDAHEARSLLKGEVAPTRLSELEEHLAVCDSCQELLHRDVGDAHWWTETESSLRDAEAWPLPEDGGESVASMIELLGPTDDPNMLGRVGPYEIVGMLGQGGMGVVFKGFDRSLDRFVAIKMLLPYLAASGAARNRFAREGKAVAAVVDDHVMAVHHVDQWQGIPYLVMNFARGCSLQKRLADAGPLELREILRIGSQAAKGLAAAHAQGIVHRDVKPANVFLNENVERVQLMDFGLARAVDDASLTRSGTIAGTPQYMSPEQAKAENVDHRGDLFSLGSVLYAMCTGRAPFRAETSLGVMRLISEDKPRPIRELNPDIPIWLCDVIGKLMAKNTGDRYQSAREVGEVLDSCLAHVQQPTEHDLPRSLQSNSRSNDARKPQLSSGGWLHGPTMRMLIAAAFVIPMIFAGALMYLETRKGMLEIESVADDVPIRILQGKEIVERLVVNREGTKTRLYSGQYVIELDVPDSTYEVVNGRVSIKQGKSLVAKIAQKPTGDAGSLKKTLPMQTGHRVNKTHSLRGAEECDLLGGSIPQATRAPAKRIDSESNHGVKRFQYKFERLEVHATDTPHEFRVRLRDDEQLEANGVWGDARADTLTVLAKSEYEEAIKRVLAKMETMAAMTPTLESQLEHLIDERRVLARTMAAFELTMVDAKQEESKDRQEDIRSRMNKLHDQIETLDKKIEILEKRTNEENPFWEERFEQHSQ